MPDVIVIGGDTQSLGQLQGLNKKRPEVLAAEEQKALKRFMKSVEKDAEAGAVSFGALMHDVYSKIKNEVNRADAM
jgi:hypothetical protein